MTDQKLLALLRSDPEAGTDRLIRQYSGLVYSIVSGILSGVCDSSEIEDCAADVFHRFIRDHGSFRSGASVKTYIGIMARNAAVDCKRKKVPYIPLDGGSVLELPDGDDVQAEAARKDMVRRVLDEIRKMGHPDSDILFCRYYLGQSSKTVAASLGMTVSNVDTRAHRALEKLKEKFGGKQET